MLMYGWDNRGDVETVMPAFEAIASSRSCSNRATAISAADGLIAAGFFRDFQRAFGEAPGLLTGVARMTDTNNTGGAVEVWYGDIALRG